MRLRVFEIVCDEPGSIWRVESVAVDQCGVGVIGCAFGKILKGFELSESSADVVANEATPEFAFLEDTHIEPGDDAEVVGAAFQSLP